MKKFCLALDLKSDPALIEAYEAWHKKVWPEVLDSIRNSGILSMEIYRTGNRMCMIMETTDDFTFEAKQTMDAGNPEVQKWEELMWSFQQPLPHAQPGEKWMLMDNIFQFKA